MPKEIEDYVHQIGRTGRSGKTGLATAFVNMNTPEETLLDLKYLLLEAKQMYARLGILLVWGNRSFDSVQDPAVLGRHTRSQHHFYRHRGLRRSSSCPLLW